MDGRRAGEKANKNYWDEVWESSILPRQVRPEDNSLRNHSYHRFHRYFTEIFRPLTTRNARLIEFGCAQSTWLSYFVRQFGFAVTGLDYAEWGCAKASAVLKRDGVQADIVCADFLDPPAHLLGEFDVGVSFGVAEHFTSTADCLSAFRRFLRPDGLLITMVPNLAGITGTLQRLLQRDIYDIHVVIDVDGLAAAHRQAGLSPFDCRYIVCSNFGVLTFGPTQSAMGRAKDRFRKLLMGLSAVSWVVDKHVIQLPENKTFSPHVVCAARNLRP
jgi:2-polyprenyl-3-methyl-5-hydroxy-6-metoxy-1,4-benzoquinol methylase